MHDNNDDIPRIIKPKPHDVFDIFIDIVGTREIIDVLIDIVESGEIINLSPGKKAPDSWR